MNYQEISKILFNWYSSNQRDLPWRKTKDAFTIWVSEIIMQQTRIAQGTPYFLRFIERFPTVDALAKSSIEDVLLIWQGLGYYSRARNMHHAAQEVMEKHNGLFPTVYSELISLKGVGKYTAAAISSISASEKKAVVDGNVIRWIARMDNITDLVDSNATLKIIENHAANIIHFFDAGILNQAMMEFGSLVCTPNSPDCNACLFHETCGAFKAKNQEIIPNKKAKSPITKRIFNYFFIVDSNHHFIIYQRTENDIWKGLFELPMVEGEDPSHFLVKQMRDKDEATTIKMKKHILSHQQIDANIKIVNVSNLELTEIATKINGQIISFEEISQFPFSKLMQQFFLLISKSIVKG